jgi:solute carrier family 25 S-adenosylmethionine transporter 26
MVQRQSSAVASSALAETLGRFRSNPFALWRGYGALASRNLPFTAIQFPLYEHLRASLTSWRRGGREANVTLGEKAVITAVSGGAAGSLASLVTTPVDVVKTRIMLSASHSSEAVASAKAVEAIKGGKVLDAVGAIRGGTSFQKTGMEIVREIVKEHGWRGLFKGGALRCGGTMLSSALYLGVYESGRQYLSGRRHASEY